MLLPRMAPHLRPDEALPDLALMSALVGRLLDASGDALRTADELHQAELSDDQRPRDLRDATAGALVDEMVRVRELATAAYGDGELRKLGVRGQTPQRDPLKIVRFARELAMALTSPSLPASRLKGYDLDRAGEAAMLTAKAAEVQRWIDAVGGEAREAQGTLVDRNQAVDVFDQDYSRCAEFVSALLRLAREDEHARRVRPPARRRSVNGAGAAEVFDDGDVADADGDGDEDGPVGDRAAEQG